VVHRDIKPQNILLRETGAAAVSDFGIARALASSTRSQTGGVMGTPAYMSPEQWEGGAVDSRLDQYGLGIVLYEIITGSPPFQGDSYGALYVQHRETPVPPIASSLQVPDEIESVIRKTLEKSPGDRYGSASELADVLEAALTGGAAQGPRTEVSPPPRREPPRPEPAAAPPARPPRSRPQEPDFGGSLLIMMVSIVVIAVVLAIVMAAAAAVAG
jgi:serine/threonine-protein kinase